MRTSLVLLLFSPFIFLSCSDKSSKEGMHEAWVPVYSTNTTAVKTISVTAPRPTLNAGKIFTVGNLIYQVEQDSGIHVINYSNPSAPQKVGFIRSFLCKELSVKNGLIYTNNLSDLVVINTTDPANVREVARTAGVFPELALQYPARPDPYSTVYFECPDPKQGVVIAWEKKTIDHPECWR